MEKVTQLGFYWYFAHYEQTIVKVVGSGDLLAALFIGTELPVPLSQLQGELVGPLPVPEHHACKSL